MKKWLYPIILIILSPLSFADEPRGVPEKLFGIKLGGVYDIGDSESKKLGNIPVKKFAGMKQFLGQGVHYYFQPKEEYKAFEYIEKKEKPEDQYFKTSFRLYLLPVIPSSISKNEQLKSTTINWEVATIEWSNDAKTKDDAYYWAMDLCKTFEVDISQKPEITNNYEEKWYACAFSSGNREFKVSSSYSRKRIELSYKREVFDKKNEAVEKIIRKIQVDDIRPY